MAIKSRRDNLYVSKHGAAVTPSGATLLDKVLGGGWAQGRVANIVGDRSTGKTLLAIEACSNFARSGGDVTYLECESAFDEPYAQRVGFPQDATLERETKTVESVFKYLEKLVKDARAAKLKRPRIVVVDSLDAVSTDAELKEELGDHGYGAVKPKLLSEMFRRLIADMGGTDLSLLIISQVRENIGVTFGAKYTRSGGKALDFYCSQIVWLSEADKLEKTIDGVTRRVGMEVRARCTKNKIGKPFREANLHVLYEFGIDDLHSNLLWLKEDVKAMETLKNLGFANPERVTRDYARLGDKELTARVAAATRSEWDRVEAKFDLGVRKYT